jgi:uncharacterized protein with HEPN domain
MRRDCALYIEDILEAIRKIDEFIGDMSFEDFLNNDMASSAVILQLIIIGEASKNIPDEMRINYFGLPWSDMARMRQNSPFLFLNRAKYCLGSNKRAIARHRTAIAEDSR